MVLAHGQHCVVQSALRLRLMLCCCHCTVYSHTCAGCVFCMEQVCVVDCLIYVKVCPTLLRLPSVVSPVTSPPCSHFFLAGVCVRRPHLRSAGVLVHGRVPHLRILRPLPSRHRYALTLCTAALSCRLQCHPLCSAIPSSAVPFHLYCHPICTGTTGACEGAYIMLVNGHTCRCAWEHTYMHVSPV